MISDGEQMKSPFLFCLSVLMENMKSRIHVKCNFLLKQQPFGSWAPSLEEKKQEHLWAVQEAERGKKFLRIVPSLWVFRKRADDK